MKKNNTAEKTILKAEKVSQALKEGTEKTLRSILNEAVSNAIKDDDEDEDITDDSYTVEDVDTANTPDGEEDTIENSEEQVEDNEDSQDETEEGEDVEPEQSEEDGPDMEDYNVGDNCYDFTSVEGDDLLKLFKKTGDNDLVYVTKSDDGNYEVKDDETGAEYVIELNPNSQEDDVDDLDVEDTEELPDEDDEEASIDLELDDDLSDNDEEASIDLELDDDLSDNEDEDIQIELDGNSEDEDEDEDTINEENLGYTTTYQKDVFANKFNMKEPSNDGRDWDKGAPKGSERQYGKKIGDSQPFEESLEENATVTKAQRRKMVKTMAPNSGEQDKPEVSKEVSVAGSKINEAKVQKIVNAAKAILAENKNIRKELEATKVALKEAAVSNGAMCSVLNLFINETTTKEEKKQIVERFLNAKTLKDVKTINESVKRELNAKRTSAPILERQFTAKQTLNETNIYDAKNNPSLDLMKRIDNLWK